MIFFYDTETTGFPNPRAPRDHERQPHIVQLAALLTDDDGTERASVNLIVAPDGWNIPAETSAIHGIDEIMALRCGVSETMAFSCWDRLGRLAPTHVAHNIGFDWMMMEIAEARLGQRMSAATAAAARICTMTSAAPIVNLPPTDRMRAAGRTGPKSPKLSECVQHFFSEEMIGAHDAMVDVRACARVFFHLKSLQKVV